MNLHKIDKLFGELDDATKGALMLAEHNGAAIEGKNHNCDWVGITKPSWHDDTVYRVRPPSPVVVPKTFHGAMGVDFHIRVGRVDSPFGIGDKTRATFTFPTIDGKHIAGVYTSPAGHQIVIEVAV